MAQNEFSKHGGLSGAVNLVGKGFGLGFRLLCL
jgi:hypothetical protein